MTRVVVLGGAGFQGARAARMLVTEDQVQELVLVDADRDAAQREAERLGANVHAASLDASDSAAVAALLRDLTPDLLLNCSGPYRLTGLSSLDAAIECGVDYVDLLDERDLIAAYLRRDEDARAAGVTAVCCTGWSPGLTNIMAGCLAADLDEVHEIHITIFGSVTLDAAPHLMLHRVQMFGPGASAVADGELVTIPGGGSRIAVEWPGCGTFPATICTHPEPATLHQTFPDLRRATVRASYTAPEFLDLLCCFARSGFLEDRPVEVSGHPIAPHEFVGTFLTSAAFAGSQIHAATEQAHARLGDLDGARVIVTGRRSGTDVARGACYLSRQRWRSTYGVAAICAALVARGELRAPGIQWPEALDSEVVVSALEASGFGFTEIPANIAPELEAR